MTHSKGKRLPGGVDLGELEQGIEEVRQVVQRVGLDPFPVHFEVVPASIMYEFGAYGLPGRFSHWTHGKAYHSLKTSYDYGLSKIYELVINANPSYAFLLDTNSLLEDKFIAAHVFAHVDFFKHNAYFAPTSRQMVEAVALHADRISAYSFEQGEKEVEQFLDWALSIAEQVDPAYHQFERAEVRVRRKEVERARAARVDADPFGDLLSPAERSALEAEQEAGPLRFPPEPQFDLLQFIADHAPDLEDWQRDILSIVREESLYFRPQMLTKIMNEGWATFWHLRIMRELPLGDKDFTDFAHLHAGVVHPSRTRLNPYYVGLKVFEDIEKRLGRDKVFEVREIECDVSFLRNYLTEELVRDLDLYEFKLDGDEWKISEKRWEKVRDALCASLVNGGRPQVGVEDADYRKNGELYLVHREDDHDLDIPYAEKTLTYIERLWGRPVHLETRLQGRKVVLQCEDGKVVKTLF